MEPLTINWDEYLTKLGNPSYTDWDFVKPSIQGPVLDVGSGHGAFVRWCVETLKQETTGLDPSEEAIRNAAQQIPSATFVVGTAEHIPSPNQTYQTVAAIEVVEHLTDPNLFFQEAFRVLRPGGTLIIQTPHYWIKRAYDLFYWLTNRKKTPKDDPTHISPFTTGRLKATAERNGFVVEALVGRNILLENRLPFLKHWKRTSPGRFFSQKLILIATRPL